MRETVEFLEAEAGSVVKAPRLPAVEIRDASDRRVLGEAMEGGADVLVSGDDDLLVVAAEVAPPIHSPRGFWDLLRSR